MGTMAGSLRRGWGEPADQEAGGVHLWGGCHTTLSPSTSQHLQNKPPDWLRETSGSHPWAPCDWGPRELPGSGRGGRGDRKSSGQRGDGHPLVTLPWPGRPACSAHRGHTGAAEHRAALGCLGSRNPRMERGCRPVPTPSLSSSVRPSGGSSFGKGAGFQKASKGGRSERVLGTLQAPPWPAAGGTEAPKSSLRCRVLRQPGSQSRSLQAPLALPAGASRRCGPRERR